MVIEVERNGFSGALGVGGYCRRKELLYTSPTALFQGKPLGLVQILELETGRRAGIGMIPAAVLI